jgi:hypothetical protein
MRCPVCRATDNQTAQCRRCKADLSLLLQLQKARGVLLDRAAQAAARGEGAACSALAAQAHQVGSDDDSLRSLAVGSLLQHDFAHAWAYYRQLRGFARGVPTS